MGVLFRKTFLFLFCCFAAVLLAGCSSSGRNLPDDCLLRVDNLLLSKDDFNNILDIMKAAYPYEALKDEKVLREIKVQLLKQLTEELILTKRADELGITVSDDELEKAVDSIRKDYPNGAFEKALLENAITFDMWKKRLKKAMLIEKVINRELVEKVRISPEEAREYYRRYHDHTDGKEQETGPKTPDIALLKQLRREKAQQAYAGWLRKIQKNYHIELNENAWKEILG